MTTATARRIDARSLRDADSPTETTLIAGTPTPANRRLYLLQIRLDGGTQPRAGLYQRHIDDLADDMQAGAVLPPVDVMYDGETYWLFDGFHRWHATKAARGDNAIIEVRVHQGSQQDAQWASFAVNKTHGLRRTTEDKQRAIVAALKHPNGAARSNREIARHLGVDDKTVGAWREKLESAAEIPQLTERTGADGKTYDTTNIGATPRHSTYASGLPKLDMPLRMAGATQPDAATASIAVLQAAVLKWVRTRYAEWEDAIASVRGMTADPHNNADMQRMAPTLPTPRREDDLLIALRNATNYLESMDSKDDLASVVPSDAAHTRQQGAPLGKCRACNRPLYDPAQAAQGIGACCAAKQAAGLGVDGDRPLPEWATQAPETLEAADLSVMQSTPAPHLDAAARKRELDSHLWHIEYMLSRLDAWGDLTGHHLDTLEAGRGLRRMQEITRRELALLRGEPVE